MIPNARHAQRLLRVVALITILFASIGSGQIAFAQTAQPHWSSQEVLSRMGIQRPAAANLTQLSLQAAAVIQAHGLPQGALKPQSPEVGGLPNNLLGSDATSAVILTNLDSSATSNFRDVMMMGDLDGREDLVADHAAKLSDQTTTSLPAGWILTRNAVSEHTFANGFTESVYYFGDSLGNVTIGLDTTADGKIDKSMVLNLPTIMNAFGNLNSDDQIVITGLAVNPVADLTSFSNVNGSFSTFSGKIGEILYVAFWDTGAGLRLTSNGQSITSGVLAFPIADVVSPAAAPPGVQSDTGFPVTVGGAFGVAFSTFANLAGIAVDDDGSIYFQQVDLTNFTGANIVKMASLDKPGPGGFQDRSLATNGFATLTTLNPTNGIYGSPSGPSNQISWVTNYSGTSTTFGNVAALAAGPNNILYAALARSYVPADSTAIQNTEGLFTNPAELGATPSMVISFADAAGAFDTCSTTDPSTPGTGTLPVGDGIADAAQAGLALDPGVNNFRVTVLGNGPDVRGHVVGATSANTLQMAFQVDDTVYSGLAVDEESKVYLVSGGTPANVGRDPSPAFSEVLVFPDQQPYDRRADFIDLRSDNLPLPYSTTVTPGDGKSDRFDHIYYQAPLDQVSLTPIGLSGLSRGFLLYLNRTRNNNTLFTTLPIAGTQGDNQTNGPIYFENFDAGHQVAGGDDQYFPFRGDDNDSGGSPTMASPLNGGFEYTFRAYNMVTDTLDATPWNAFYLNSNGSLTFGSGDTSFAPGTAFLGSVPRIAGAWTDLNPGSRASYPNTFPVQAMGFAGINNFVVRWIGVPSKGFENCNSSNSFSISLYDDGTGVDENANQPLNPANPIGNNAVPFDLQEGPTDLRYFSDTLNNTITGAPARPDHSGNLCLTYGRMDLLGSNAAGDPVLVGVTPGDLPSTSVPGINLSQNARAHDTAFPNALGIAMGSTIPASPYEFFTQGTPASASDPAMPAFDLRQEGNDPAQSSAANQPDPNRGQVCFHNLNTQSITFHALADKLINQLPITVSATASSGLTVAFTASGSCTASGTNGATIQATGIGLCTVTARQNGNATYAAAPNVVRTFTIEGVTFVPLVKK